MNTHERNSRAAGRSGQHKLAGGAVDTLCFAAGDSDLGTVLVASTERGLRAVILGDDETAVIGELRARFPDANLVTGGQEPARLLAAVKKSIEFPDLEFSEPIDSGGTEFQRSVWRELRRIPAGETATYAEIARRVGRPAAVRAVGTACGANPLAVVIPCHRVVGSDGALTGYRWGLARKRRLLELESRSAGEGRG